MRLRIGLGSLVLALPVLVMQTSMRANAAAYPSAMGVHTRVVHVRPFTPSGVLAQGYSVGATAKGYCWTNSISTSRSDAYRCIVKNRIYDPCFANPKGNEVACVYSWQVTTVMVMTLTKKLPHPQVGGHHSAWQLELSSGALCRFETGATFANHGLRANFDCTNKTWLFGHAKTGSEPWKIRWARGMHGKLKWASVKTAWF